MEEEQGGNGMECADIGLRHERSFHGSSGEVVPVVSVEDLKKGPPRVVG
jgi:hypothetical protein